MPRLSEHVEWLSLVDVSGPFLAPLVLEEVFPQGLEKVETPRRQRLRAAYDEWRDAVDEDDPELGELHAAWTRMVIQDALEYEDEVLVTREGLGDEVVYRAPEHGVEVAPDLAVRGNDGKPRLLIAIHPPETDLEKPPAGDRWPASPAERMTLLCRSSGVRIGLVTNGEQWMLVNAPVGSTSGYASWFARIWWQEPLTLKAFVSLLGVRRCFGSPEATLDELLERSLAFQEEVTDTLGEQVRRAVEVLIQALGRADQDRNGELLRDVAPAELYEAGLTVMMRLVFILCAEERGLLLLGEPIYDQNYAISTLRAALREDESLHGPEVLERRHDAWSRMLSVFRAVYGGVEHESLRMPALGGSLFDPDRFPFLEGRARGSSWREEPAVPLPIDNRTVLLLLTALQVLEQRGGAQLLSYRALDVEQIGHVYEGLLEYTAVRLSEVTVGLVGSQKVGHPAICLSELETLWANGINAASERLAGLTGRSETAIRNALERGGDEAAFPKVMQACGGDEALARRILPFAELIRTDSWGSLLIYRAGSFAVTHGADRRETGTHYTPRSLTEVIVEKTLEPLVYAGPAEGEPREEWKLRTPCELLDLKICDPAMGSGAFLVQTCRYLAERLVEAWAFKEDAGRFVTVDGAVVKSPADHELLPKSLDDRLLIAKRLIAERCLYGVDLNPLAVELAKLSIWLVTLAKDRPFGFLDHNLRCGDSLLGIHRLDQLTRLEMDPGSRPRQQRLFGRSIEAAVEKAIGLRKRLREIPIRDIRDVEGMARLDEESRVALGYPSLVADAFIGEVLRGGGNCHHSNAAIDQLSAEADSAFAGDGDGIQALLRRAASSLSVDLSTGQPARRPFHWPLEFPEVFAGERAGFDAVIGNPPFLNAIEHADLRDEQVRGYYDLSYQPFAAGAYDLCLLFWARALRHLLWGSGRYGLLSPTVILSATSEWKRWMHGAWRPDFFCLNPVDMFAAARIRTTAICGGKGTSAFVDVLDRDTRASPETSRCDWSDSDINWYEVTQAPTAARHRLGRMRSSLNLCDCADVFAGCTTADAYNLKPLIEDRDAGRGPKLVTTGAIDRYVLKWGRMRIRYLKDDYEHPRWPERPSDKGVQRAAARQVGEKILVGGLTAVIEAWLDTRGEAAGVVQTWVIKPKIRAMGHHGVWWHVLLGVLNSATFSRIFVNRHGAGAMSGKQITVKKKSLLEMPVPALLDVSEDHGDIERRRLTIPPLKEWSSDESSAGIAAALSRTVRRLLDLRATDDQFPVLDKLAHHLAGALYGLSEDECENDYQWWCSVSGSTVCDRRLEWVVEAGESGGVLEEPNSESA
jgi:hypothetical protein